MVVKVHGPLWIGFDHDCYLVHLQPAFFICRLVEADLKNGPGYYDPKQLHSQLTSRTDPLTMTPNNSILSKPRMQHPSLCSPSWCPLLPFKEQQRLQAVAESDAKRPDRNYFATNQRAVNLAKVHGPGREHWAFKTDPGQRN